MSLLQEWRDLAYEQEQDEKEQKKFWTEYFEMEKEIYVELLQDTKIIVEATFVELAEKYKIDKLHFVGFLDGINDSLVNPIDLDEILETSTVKLEIDHEKLYYNMLAAKAEWLYTLPQWDEILSEEKRKEIIKEQRESGTIVKEKAPGRNDPCPCGSGKKHKKCCGANK